MQLLKVLEHYQVSTTSFFQTLRPHIKIFWREKPFLFVKVLDLDFRVFSAHQLLILPSGLNRYHKHGAEIKGKMVENLPCILRNVFVSDLQPGISIGFAARSCDACLQQPLVVLSCKHIREPITCEDSVTVDTTHA